MYGPQEMKDEEKRVRGAMGFQRTWNWMTTYTQHIPCALWSQTILSPIPAPSSTWYD